jgi:shikimate kinase
VALRRAGVELRGFRGVLSSDVPIGAGMASSAALLVALTGALLLLAGRDADLYAVAELAYVAWSWSLEEGGNLSSGLRRKPQQVVAQKQCPVGRLVTL